MRAESKKNLGSSSSAASTDWQECYDDQGNLYYYNAVTNETSWEKPADLLSGGATDWQECYDEQGNLYYYNAVTNETSWEKPASSGPASIEKVGKENDVVMVTERQKRQS